ncbi:MAG: NfeD family protein [Comamonas sp.]
MADSTIWWVLAGLAVTAELFVGMFYLLMIAVGLAAGAVAAHLGLGPVGQLAAAAVVGSGFVLACYRVRRKRAATRQRPNRDINLDIGEHVTIDAWQADGTARVHYRGARWTAVPAAGSAPGTGLHRVKDLDGNRLVVEKA